MEPIKIWPFDDAPAELQFIMKGFGGRPGVWLADVPACMDHYPFARRAWHSVGLGDGRIIVAFEEEFHGKSNRNWPGRRRQGR